MIALGRDGDHVVFFGSAEDGTLVQFRCNLKEAESALWQLKAMLGHDPEQANRRMMALEQAVAGLRSESMTLLALPQRELGPESARPIPARVAFYGPAPAQPGGLVTLATSLEDAAREAEERDAREVQARANQQYTGQRIVQQASQEELAKQETRRARVLARSGGEVEGPVDE